MSESENTTTTTADDILTRAVTELRNEVRHWRATQRDHFLQHMRNGTDPAGCPASYTTGAQVATYLHALHILGQCDSPFDARSEDDVVRILAQVGVSHDGEWLSDNPITPEAADRAIREALSALGAPDDLLAALLNGDTDVITFSVMDEDDPGDNRPMLPPPAA